MESLFNVNKLTSQTLLEICFIIRCDLSLHPNRGPKDLLDICSSRESIQGLLRRSQEEVCNNQKGVYLCRRAVRPSWCHTDTAMAPHTSRVRTPGEACTCHRTALASHTGTYEKCHKKQSLNT